MPAAAHSWAQLSPRSTIRVTSTGSAPYSRTTSTASISEVPRVVVSSVITTLSPGSRAPAIRPVTPWSLDSLRTLKLRRSRPRVAATAATPKATGSAPIVSPPMAVASEGTTSSIASATNRIPSGRHAVCLVSRNHELVAPDLSVNCPRFTEWVSTCSRRAWSFGGSGGSEVLTCESNLIFGGLATPIWPIQRSRPTVSDRCDCEKCNRRQYWGHGSKERSPCDVG
jgi:hypothetical protein